MPDNARRGFISASMEDGEESMPHVDDYSKMAILALNDIHQSKPSSDGRFARVSIGEVADYHAIYRPPIDLALLTRLVRYVDNIKCLKLEKKPEKAKKKGA